MERIVLNVNPKSKAGKMLKDIKNHVKSGDKASINKIDSN